MRLKIANILLLLFSLLGHSSCLYEKLGECPGNEPGGVVDHSQYVYLNMSVGVDTPSADPKSRAEEVNDSNYFEREAINYERMNTLRVIIVRGERDSVDIVYSPDSAGYIEHNRLFTLNDEGLVKYDNMLFRVHAGEKKRIYLIANEQYLIDTLKIDFDSFKPGTEYSDRDSIENIVLSSPNPGAPLIDNAAADTTSRYYIPMSEVFDINLPLPEHPEDYEVKKEFFVTRAAVKFSFNILTPGYPDYDNGLRIKKITVDSVGNREYFLPRARYYPEKDSLSSFNEHGRFIVDYDLPTDTALVDSPCVFTAGLEDIILNNTTENKGKHPLIPKLYFPESYKGDYYLSITLGNKEDDKKDYTFQHVKLNNLSSLPRNTHVLVNITLKGAQIEAVVKLVPYIGVNLEYPFGFEDLVPWVRPTNPNI